MILLRNSEINPEKWDTLLSESNYSSPFQTRDFFQFYNSVPGHSAEAFGLEDSGNLFALCVIIKQKEKGVKAFFSRRAIIYGSPLFIDGSERSVELLLQHVSLELKKEAIYIEVRNYFDAEKLKSAYTRDGWKWIPYLDIHLSLKEYSLEDILGKMKYNRRREIKLSISEGATYREAKDSSDIECLYHILKDLYTDKVKLPLPDIDFFYAMFRSTTGKVFIVLHKEKIIGGSFCFYLKRKAIYTMYYCGIRNYHKKIFPTHLSILSVIDFGIRNNIEYLDFMGAGVKGKEYGVRNYKEEFGGELLEYGRFRKINNRFLFQVGELGLKMLKLIH